MNAHNLYNTILYTLRQEDLELSLLSGEGIFYAPELYIAFLLGKAIKKNEIDIFGVEVKWKRETSIGETGPTDFAFKADDVTHAFELKLRNTIHSYDADVDKLHSILLLEEHHIDKGIVRVAPIISFPTEQRRYKNPICCTVALWTIN